jgi:hypothetical protein
MESLLELLFRGLSAGSALIAVICAVYVANRASGWRNSDEAKTMERRVTDIEKDCSNIKTRLDGMPSKGDFEGLKSDVRALGRDVEKVDAGVSRIESFLIEKGSK